MASDSRRRAAVLGVGIGLLAGYFGGLVGLGGGVIMIPLMVALLKLTQHQAHGTSLVALVFTGLSGALAYALGGSVDVVASLLLAATAMFTARFGARYAHALPEWKLKRAFGAFLLFVSVLLVSKPYLPHVATRLPAAGEAALLLLTGLFTGFLSGMMGVGGGSIMVPAMVFLGGFSQVAAQGVSLLAMVPSGAVGAYTHGRLGNVRPDVLVGLVPGILIGSFAGGLTAHELTEQALRLIFAVVQVWMGIRYLRTPRPAASGRNGVRAERLSREKGGDSGRGRAPDEGPVPRRR
ncbi:MAG: sulfite exporter TauE/SafE family protein [Hydrogenibacillus schlegelii]|uniref:Probable membrane transporter protein n=1 Tax=Hydrogenibacillus schlegelii TaxID=1484 RepID=A0A947G955_HYDSH|nr:sulfite exporter TauE/SafE family protein [Hydrogenibacillus schlegelii]